MGYRIETRTFEELQGKLNLPNFQRALVWSNNQKKEFFNTLKDGFPFGSILLYEYEREKTKDNENRYSLIDGLQRYSTMLDFKDNPTNYIEFDEFAERIARLYKNASKSTTNEVVNFSKDTLLEIVKQNNDPNSPNTRATALSKKVIDKFPALDDQDIRDEITEIQQEVTEFFNNQLNISKVKIPCIIFEGDETQLAEVFQRLNSGGKKLSKYQVFAAHWDKYNIELSKAEYSNKILDNIIDRYETLNNDRGILIEDFDTQEMRNSREINLSEFCYGLGKILAEELYIFFDKISEDICNELGFQTMLMIFDIPTSKMNTLPHFHKYLKNGNNIEDMVSKIVGVYKIINNKFDNIFTLSSLTRKKKHETKSFTRLQIMSFFASLWQVSYSLILDETKDSLYIKEKQGRKKERQKILDNIVSYSIYDIIRNYWSGTGDKKLMDIYINKNNRYSNALPKEIFMNELLRWNDESINKSSVNIQSDEKMIISCIANTHSDFYKGLNDNFDYEHIFSRKLYNKHKNNHLIPAGALGNIMLLDEGSNRKKKEKFLYEIFNLDNINKEDTHEYNYIKYSSYPEKRVIDKIEFDLVAGEYDSLINMIKTRGDLIIKELTNSLYS